MDDIKRGMILPLLAILTYTAGRAYYNNTDDPPIPELKLKKGHYASKSNQRTKLIDSRHNNSLPKLIKKGCMESQNYDMSVEINNDEIVVMLKKYHFQSIKLIYKYLDISQPGPLVTVSPEHSTKYNDIATVSQMEDLMITINTKYINNYYSDQYHHCRIYPEMNISSSEYTSIHNIMSLNDDSDYDDDNARVPAKQSLNPDAPAFIPNNSPNRPRLSTRASPRHTPTLSPLNEHPAWELLISQTFEELKGNQSRFNVLFIPPEVTEKAVKLIKEYFPHSRALYQYLRNKIIIMTCIPAYTILERGGEVIVLFDVELHDHDGDILYVVAIENDANHAGKWKMEDFMTVKQLWTLHNIPPDVLPSCPESEYHSISVDMDYDKYSADLRGIDWSNRNEIKITGSKKQTDAKITKDIEMSIEEFVECVITAQNDKQNNHFRNIIWVNDKRGKYESKPILLVPLHHNKCIIWIGITFDFDEEEQKEWSPKEILIDSYDIRNKMALFKPFKDHAEYQQFENMDQNKAFKDAWEIITHLTIEKCRYDREMLIWENKTMKSLMTEEQLAKMEKLKSQRLNGNSNDSLKQKL